MLFASRISSRLAVSRKIFISNLPLSDLAAARAFSGGHSEGASEAGAPVGTLHASRRSGHRHPGVEKSLQSHGVVVLSVMRTEKQNHIALPCSLDEEAPGLRVFRSEEHT